MTRDEERQIRAMALLEVHESKRAVRLHTARLTQIANALDATARTLKELINDQSSSRNRATGTVLDALPSPKEVHRAVAELTGERTRQAEARQQAARLNLLD